MAEYERSPSPGGFRLNIGAGKDTFERLVGSIDEPDNAARERLSNQRRRRQPE